MSESTWTVPEPRKLTFDGHDEQGGDGGDGGHGGPVTKLQVRIVNGTVNVVGTEESSARLEVSSIEGPPLIVTRDGSTLTVAYEDLPWRGFLKWLDRKAWNRSAVVSLAVPADADVEVGTVGAGSVVSGIRGRTEVRGVSGDTTLVKLAGPIKAESVTGNLEAQAVTGELRFKSVSGDLTVVEGAGGRVAAESVSGDMLLDLDPGTKATDIRLTTVSGEVAIRLPHPADARVEANTTSGTVSSAFEDLRISGQWGTKKITGTLGAGNGTLRATTVSGAIALLRRPTEPVDAAEATESTDAGAGDEGSPPPGGSPTSPSAGSSTDPTKKVL
ncbi:DUF4097 family beta strand repeat-containing protein [Streptomyces sp. ASQP_92]|uniref:DUF4097 family beta strand repeat-containing protein n=1 Tax=Streptomyces sp. ASQP_92 TaxID=2979116 RepID=UPI0021BE5EEB|nr:DUF4097 family beta strand repeat-containing protein [Streptomyces sp. ASQP_92]MCT9090900.1 DUF4097 family beta strand repeat-containing protein [Streptomyces sp. ASQP_92]